MTHPLKQAAQISVIPELAPCPTVSPDNAPVVRGTGADEPCSAAPLTGTKALMLAVLDEAVGDYFGSSRRLRDDAECWIRSQQRSVFSFDVVCETLGIEPSAARRALRIRRVACEEISAGTGDPPITRPNIKKIRRPILRPALAGLRPKS